MFVALGSRHPRHGPAVGSRGLRNRPQKGTVRASVAAPALVWAASIIALLILVIRAAREKGREEGGDKGAEIRGSTLGVRALIHGRETRGSHHGERALKALTSSLISSFAPRL